MDKKEEFFHTRPATAMRPLLGLTVLVVEDSRFACEALRLLCLRSGARIRRADSLYAAKQHLKVYRPSVIIVDVGLPDGEGTSLIETLSKAPAPIEVILGTSGDADRSTDVIAAGAHDFLGKPVTSLASFQDLILKHLPAERQPPGPRLVSDEEVQPDIIAFHDDLSHVAQLLSDAPSSDDIDYVTQFLAGIAKSADDDALQAATAKLANKRLAGEDTKGALADLHVLVDLRLSAAGPFENIKKRGPSPRDTVQSMH